MRRITLGDYDNSYIITTTTYYKNLRCLYEKNNAYVTRSYYLSMLSAYSVGTNTFTRSSIGGASSGKSEILGSTRFAD